MRRFLLNIAIAASLLASCTTPKTAQKSSAAPQELTVQQQIKLQEMFINGVKEKTLGNFELAIQYYNNCLKLDPNNGAALFELAQIHQFNGREDVSLNFAKRAAQQDPKNKWYVSFLADRYAANGKLADAAQTYRHLIELEPYRVEHLYQLAYIYQLSGNLELAIETYDKVEEISGVQEDVVLQKQRMYDRLSEPQKAIEEIQKLIDSNPNEIRYYGILAEIYQQNGMLSKANEVYEKIKELDPNNPFLHLALVDYYRQNGEEEKAMESFRSAFRSPDLQAGQKLDVIRDFYQMTMHGDSLRGFVHELTDIALEVHPDEDVLHAMKGDLLFRDNELDSAQSSYRKALDINKSHPVLWSKILMVNGELSDTTSMLKDSEQAIELFPTIPGFYLFNGIARLQREEYQKAVDVLKSGRDYVVEDDAVLVQFLANLGDAYYNLNDFANSDTYYEEALDVDSMNTYVLNNYSYYLSLRKENLERAATLSKRSNDLDPHSAAYQDTYGWILFQLGRYDEALQWIELSMKNGGEQSGVILEHLGDVLFKLGREQEALERWKQAKKLGDTSDFLDMKIKDSKLYE